MACHRFLRRQRVRGRVQGIEQVSQHHRAIGVALVELHEHLPADPRNHDRAGGVRMGRANPACRALVELAVEVPRELHLYAPVLVAMDLLARRTANPRCLETVDLRAWRDASRAKPLVARDALEGNDVFRPRYLVASALVVTDRRIERDRNDDVFARCRRVIEQLEAPAGLQHEQVTHPARPTTLARELLQADGRAPRPFAGNDMTAGILVMLTTERLVRVRLSSQRQGGTKPS